MVPDFSLYDYNKIKTAAGSIHSSFIDMWIVNNLFGSDDIVDERLRVNYFLN